MKSKIIALSKNEEFKTLLKKKKVSNKYVTIFFGSLGNKNRGYLNISFVTNIDPITACSASILFGNSLNLSLTILKLFSITPTYRKNN